MKFANLVKDCRVVLQAIDNQALNERQAQTSCGITHQVSEQQRSMHSKENEMGNFLIELVQKSK